MIIGRELMRGLYVIPHAVLWASQDLPPLSRRHTLCPHPLTPSPFGLVSSPPDPLSVPERGDAMRVLEGCAEQSFEVVAGHVSVRDPKDLKTGALKNGTAGRVVAPLRLRVVRVTIHFDYDPGLSGATT